VDDIEDARRRSAVDGCTAARASGAPERRPRLWRLWRGGLADAPPYAILVVIA
jgi:hypothetical protein